MRILFLFSTLIFLLAGSQQELPGVPLATYKTPIDKVIFLPSQAEGTYNKQDAELMISRLHQLPLSLQEQIVKHHIQIKLFNGKLTDEPSAAHLKGLSPRGYTSTKTWDEVPGIGGGKVVLVKIGHSDKGAGHGSVNLELHELAHSLNRHVFDEISKTPEFKSIWNEEKQQLFGGQEYFLSYPEEYFAEVFALFYLNENTNLQLTRAPKSYTFIKELSK